MKPLPENPFYLELKNLIEQSRKQVYQTVNFSMVRTYWEIGKRIVEEEQKGNEKANYGDALIESLAIRLTDDFGKGFDKRNLFYMRRFYLAFQKVNALRSLLSWTHYRILLQVEDEPARTFYMNETAENNWSTRQLERQIQSHYYHRILANQKADKRDTTMPVANENSYYPEAFIKDPYVLEFLNLKPYPDFKERNLEEALLEKLQDFLLELGKGFCFVARQKHISTDRNKHYYIDLVFYNYLLRCFVLIDLKMGSLTAEDVGKMDMYVRFYEDRFKPVGDNPTLGIILCSQSDETVVKYSILNDSKQLFASQYQLVIPQKEVLVSFINREIENIKTENELREKYVHYGKELQNKIS